MVIVNLWYNANLMPIPTASVREFCFDIWTVFRHVYGRNWCNDYNEDGTHLVISLWTIRARIKVHYTKRYDFPGVNIPLPSNFRPVPRGRIQKLVYFASFERKLLSMFNSFIDGNRAHVGSQIVLFNYGSRIKLQYL